MKKFFLSALLLSFLAAAQAQDNIQLVLSPRLGASPFSLNTPVSAGPYNYKITRLEYYISEIKITHDGGQETAMTDMYLLVRPKEDSLYDLGSHPEITNVESITFSVGVDQAHNHLDPATYPSGHPLAPQNPEMQWGWAAGYRFVAIEGKAGANYANTFQIHALGDANYKTLTLPTLAENLPDGNKVIRLTADYLGVLNSINVSTGPIVHGSGGAAITVMNNMKDIVFSAQTSAVADPAFEGVFSVSPNPAAAGQAVATMRLPAGSGYRITLSDLSGRILLSKAIPADRQSFAFGENLNRGVYFVQLWQNDRPVVSEKLVVVK